jgi:hypothetical protein
MVDDWELYARNVAVALKKAGFMRVCTALPNDATQQEIDLLESTIATATDEKPLQQLLKDHPALLAQEYNSSCRWIKDQVRLGNQYVPDFMACRLDSTGVKWTLVELQSPTERLFNTKDRPGEHLAEGLAQINSWRTWLTDNVSYARDQLGLIGIDARDAVGLILVGRSSSITEHDRTLLRGYAVPGLSVHSYDWLVRDARKRKQNAQSWISQGNSASCEECDLIRDYL